MPPFRLTPWSFQDWSGFATYSAYCSWMAAQIQIFPALILKDILWNIVNMGFLRSLLSFSDLTNPSFVELSTFPTPSLPDGLYVVIYQKIVLHNYPQNHPMGWFQLILPTGFPDSGAGRIDTTLPFYKNLTVVLFEDTSLFPLINACFFLHFLLFFMH